MLQEKKKKKQLLDQSLTRNIFQLISSNRSCDRAKRWLWLQVYHCHCPTKTVSVESQGGKQREWAPGRHILGFLPRAATDGAPTSLQKPVPGLFPRRWARQPGPGEPNLGVPWSVRATWFCCIWEPYENCLSF